jgi:hypothetical protein
MVLLYTKKPDKLKKIENSIIFMISLASSRGIAWGYYTTARADFVQSAREAMFLLV